MVKAVNILQRRKKNEKVIASNSKCKASIRCKERLNVKLPSQRPTRKKNKKELNTHIVEYLHIPYIKVDPN